MTRPHWPAWALVVAALVVAIGGTALADAVRGPSAQLAKAKKKKHPHARSAPVVSRKMIDAEVRRLAPTIYVGRADYAATTNIANRAALADQASNANSATKSASATHATRADSAARADGAPLASIDYAAQQALLRAANDSSAPGPPAPTPLTVSVTCPAGLQVLSGGASVSDPQNAYVIDSGPSGATGWKADAFARNPTGVGTTLSVTAVCAPVAGGP